MIKLLILYGSQTGTAQEYAEGIYLEATMKGMQANVMSLNDYVKKRNQPHDATPISVIIIANTGDGDAPDNATLFWKWIEEHKEETKLFFGYRIALLGLGDSGYATFNSTGKFLQEILPQMGASWLLPPAFCDALVGNDVVWEPWQRGLWLALDASINNETSTTQAPKQGGGVEEQGAQQLPMQMEKLSLVGDKEASGFSFWALPLKNSEELPKEITGPSPGDAGGSIAGKVTTVAVSYVGQDGDEIFHDALAADEDEASILSPVIAREVTMKVLTTQEAIKEVTLVSFTVTDHRWRCEAGDSFALCCENDPLIVDSLLKLLELDGSCLIKVTPLIPVMSGSLLELIAGQTLSIRDVFLKHVDIMHFPKKAFLRSMAEFCRDANDRQNLLYLASKTGSSEYMALANEHASLIDFIYTFHSCKPSLDFLLGHLPALHPRFYSVCSAGSARVPDDDKPQSVEFVYSCMDYTLPSGSARRGVCSAWLERIKERIRGGEKKLSLKVFPRPAPHFRLPEDPSTPMIMICAGTGISPFVGFLRTLEKSKVTPTFTWLIFGFRHRSHDFLFADELKRYESSGILSHLTIATSREPESGHPKYVQGALQASSKEIYDLMMGSSTARIYICGDELTMIKDVNVAIQEMLKEHGKMDASQALSEFNSWNSTKRIIRDVWV